jgi:hypothetical protein
MYEAPYAPEMTPKQEAKLLKQQVKDMEAEIKALTDRIAELESDAKR